MLHARDLVSGTCVNQALEVEAVLRDEYRVHLQRNFMIWYKEEQHLKEQLRCERRKMSQAFAQ